MVTVIPTLSFQPGFGNSLDAAMPRLIAQQVNKPTTRLVSLSPRFIVGQNWQKRPLSHPSEFLQVSCLFVLKRAPI